MLIACHLGYRRLHLIGRLRGAIVYLESHPCLLATGQFSVTTGIQDSRIADFQDCLCTDLNGWSTGWSTTKVLTEAIETVVSTTRRIKATVGLVVITVIATLRLHLTAVTALTVLHPLLAISLILLVITLLGLVGCSTYRSSHHSTASHTDQRTNIATMTSAGDATDSRADDRAKRSSRIGSHASISSTAGQQQERTYRY